MLPDFITFLATFLIVLLMERVLHRSLQELMMLVTGDIYKGTMLYALVLLPGVALHEASHAVAAALLGVKVRKFSLLPKRQSAGIQLGFVEITQTNTLRSSIIGAAPLFTGLIALILIGWFVFDFGQLMAAMQTGDVSNFLNALIAITRKPDAALWFYVVFAIANTMMPSPSDKQAWPPVLLGLGAVAVLVLLVGGMDVVRAAEPLFRTSMRWLTAAFIITVFIDMIVAVLLWVASRVVERVTGRSLRYK